MLTQYEKDWSKVGTILRNELVHLHEELQMRKEPICVCIITVVLTSQHVLSNPLLNMGAYL